MIENRTLRFATTRIVTGYDLRWPAVIIQRPIQRPIQAHTEVVTMRPNSELFIRAVSFFSIAGHFSCFDVSISILTL